MNCERLEIGKIDFLQVKDMDVANLFSAPEFERTERIVVT